jgi:hypothetical protein
VTPALELLQSALTQLALDARGQRALLAGAVVTDELALDIYGAVGVVRGSPEALAVLGPAGRADLERLDDLLDAPPAADLWDDGRLDSHPVWCEARVIARRLLGLLPAGTGGSAPPAPPD